MEPISGNDEILIKETGGNQYLYFRRLLAYPEVLHCVTLKPLDFRQTRVGTAREAEKAAAEALGIDPARICRPLQTHTDNVRAVTGKDAGIFPPSLTNVDGLVTDSRDLCLLVTAADCTPLLFYDPVRHTAGCVHSGWRGTLQRIAYKAVREMVRAYGSDPADLICCIGPHIRQCCFEVDADVAEAFRKEFREMPDLEEIIAPDPARNKYHIDTLRINRNLLLSAGLRNENIADSGVCTVCRSDICHSYRADKALSGRAAALIALR